MKAIGVDLGITNSVIAYMHKEEARVLENQDNDTLTPSVLHLTEKNEWLVGKRAKAMRSACPETTVTQIQRFMGRDYQDPAILKDIYQASYQIEQGITGEVEVVLGGRHFTPPEISAFILEALKNDAETWLGEQVSQAVITMPAHFTLRQKEATYLAGRLAGFSNLRTVTEPTAIALAYNFGTDIEEPKTVLIYDLDESTFEVSVLSVASDAFIILGTTGNLHLGGADFDEMIVDWLIERVKAQQKTDLINRSDATLIRFRLLEAAEYARIKLLHSLRTQIILPGLIKSGNKFLDIECELTRDDINQLIEPLVSSTLQLTDQAMKLAQKKPEDMDAVLLSGVATRLPLIEEKLRHQFGDRLLAGWTNPKTCVALGAAIYTCLDVPETVPAKDLRLNHCGHCGSLNLEDRLGCRRCGKELVKRSVQVPKPVQIECWNCGTSNPQGQEKCSRCGESLTRWDQLVTQLPVSIGFEGPDRQMVVLFENGAIFPSQNPVIKVLVTSLHGQPRAILSIYEGNEREVTRNHYLGDILIQMPPDLPKATRIEAAFTLDVDGILSVTAKLPDYPTLKAEVRMDWSQQKASPPSSSGEPGIQLPRTAHQLRLAVAALVNTNQIATAQELVNKADRLVKPDLLVMIATACTRQGEYKQALAGFTQALEIDPRHALARQGASDLLTYQAVQQIEKKEWRKASELIKQAIHLDPENDQLLRIQSAVEAAAVMTGISTDRLQDAITALERLQKGNPHRPDLAHQLALLNHQLAIEMDESSQSRLRDACWEKAFSNWAVALVNNEYWKEWGQFRQAVYDQVVSADEIEKLHRDRVSSKIREVHQQFIRAYSEANNTKEVERHKRLQALWMLELDSAQGLKDTLQLLPHAEPALFPSGPLAWQQHNLQAQVEKAAQSALQKNKSFRPAQIVLEAAKPTGLARAMIRQGQYDDAIVILETYLLKAPKDKETQQLLAEAWQSKALLLAGSDLEAAIDAMRKAKSYGAIGEKIEESLAEAVLKRSLELEKAGKLEEAEKILRLGIKNLAQNRSLKDKLAEIARDRALKYMETNIGKGKDPKKALSVLEKTQGMLRDADTVAGPRHPIIQGALDELQSARATLLNAAAVELANEAGEIFQEKDDYAGAMKKLDEALSLLNEASRGQPGDSTVKSNLEQVRQAKAALNSAQAGRLNARAVELANEAQQDAMQGWRSSACSELRQAMELLEEAEDYDRYNSTIQNNKAQISQLIRALNC
jgi:molecular chaperone DnaK (HSP70)